MLVKGDYYYYCYKNTIINATTNDNLKHQYVHRQTF